MDVQPVATTPEFAGFLEYLFQRRKRLPRGVIDLMLMRAHLPLKLSSLKAELSDVVRANRPGAEVTCWPRNVQLRYKRTLERANALEVAVTTRDPATIHKMAVQVYPWRTLHTVSAETLAPAMRWLPSMVEASIDRDMAMVINPKSRSVTATKVWDSFCKWLNTRWNVPLPVRPPTGKVSDYPEVEAGSAMERWLTTAKPRAAYIMTKAFQMLPSPLPDTDAECIDALGKLFYPWRRTAFNYMQEFYYWAHKEGLVEKRLLVCDNPWGRSCDPAWMDELAKWHEAEPEAMRYSWYVMKEHMAAALTRAGGYTDPKVLLRATLTLPNKGGTEALPRAHCRRVLASLQRFLEWKLGQPYTLDTEFDEAGELTDVRSDCDMTIPVTIDFTVGELRHFKELLISAMGEMVERQDGTLALYAQSKEPVPALLDLLARWWGTKFEELATIGVMGAGDQADLKEFLNEVNTPPAKKPPPAPPPDHNTSAGKKILAERERHGVRIKRWRQELRAHLKEYLTELPQDQQKQVKGVVGYVISQMREPTPVSYLRVKAVMGKHKRHEAGGAFFDWCIREEYLPWRLKDIDPPKEPVPKTTIPKRLRNRLRKELHSYSSDSWEAIQTVVFSVADATPSAMEAALPDDATQRDRQEVAKFINHCIEQDIFHWDWPESMTRLQRTLGRLLWELQTYTSDSWHIIHEVVERARGLTKEAIRYTIPATATETDVKEVETFFMVCDTKGLLNEK